MGVPVTAGTGLLGRWGLDEGTGLVATNSVVTSPLTNGTLAPTATPPVWVAGGSPFIPRRRRAPTVCTWAAPLPPTITSAWAPRRA